MTELYSLIAATAAKRLGLCPVYAHLDTTSLHVDGRYNSDEEPSEHVVHITQGYSHDHRPDLNQVMLELIIEHQAGIPVLMRPLSGNSSDAQEFGHVIRTHIEQLHATYGATSVVAEVPSIVRPTSRRSPRRDAVDPPSARDLARSPSRPGPTLIRRPWSRSPRAIAIRR